MIIKENTVLFEACDMSFVKKFGISQATEMVLDYKSVNPLPFLYDTYQAAAFFPHRSLDFVSVCKRTGTGLQADYFAKAEWEHTQHLCAGQTS